ncbi:hypothetical protein JYG56_24110, partial [Escherichia fergusonii]|nr:hypothetical protein [Escherichia fergusonii]
GLASEVLRTPSHPYTQSLLDALPSRSKPGQRLGAGANDNDSESAAHPVAATMADPSFVAMDGLVKVFEQKRGFWARLGERAGLLKSKKPVL